jgi:hypothetical protein
MISRSKLAAEVLLAFTVVLGWGCAPSAPEPRVETIGDVTVVHNPAQPLDPDWAIAFEEELTLGGDQGPEEAILYRPRSILVDERGDMYVSDYQDAVIKVFDAEGRFVRTIGRKGEGPGEFQAMTDTAFLPDGRLLVLDIRSRRTSLFDRNGNFLRSHPWKNSCFDILLTDAEGYLTDENVYAGEERKVLVTKFDFEGNQLERWGEFTAFGIQMKRVGDTMLSITTPYTPRSIFAGDQARGRLYHCLNHTYLIEVYEAPGKLVRKIDRPYTPVPFTKEDAEEYYDGFDRRGNAAFSQMAREVDLPEVKTITDGMGVDDLGNLWVGTNEIDESGGAARRAFDIFDPDGRYRARIWLDFAPGLFVRGRMYRVAADEETGFMSVKRYRVIRPD